MSRTALPVRAGGVVRTRPRFSTGTVEAPQTTATPKESQSPGWQVVVYDNDFNTYVQVMTILMIATGCTEEEAWMEAWEIDHLGRSVVHHGAQPECERVAKVVATIGIRVESVPE